jgi:hypothetical protein
MFGRYSFTNQEFFMKFGLFGKAVLLAGVLSFGGARADSLRNDDLQFGRDVSSLWEEYRDKCCLMNANKDYEFSSTRCSEDLRDAFAVIMNLHKFISEATKKREEGDIKAKLEFVKAKAKLRGFKDSAE